MFADPNRQATARRKLTTLHQGDSSVEELIREFEIHGPISGLGDVGLVDHFEQVIHPCLHEAFTVSSPCHPLGQSGSARPPCLTTSGGDSETPSRRLHQPNHPHSALPLSPPSPPPLLPPPPPAPPPLLCLQALNPWT